MSEIEIPKRFELLRTIPDVVFFSFKVSLPEIEMVYGRAHQESSTAWNVPGPALYWGFEYACELKILFEFHCFHKYVNIYADQPGTEHILSHLSLPMKDVWQVPTDDERLNKYFPPNNSAWNLWRQDDNGHKEIFKTYSWEREARCRLRQFEKLHHKQTYWLEKIEAR